MIWLDQQLEWREWDNYVAGNRQASFAHLYGWTRALARTYALQSYYLAARDSGRGQRVVGVLPLLLFDPPGGVPRLISLPYTDRAGVLADSPEAAQRLLSGAVILAQQLGAYHLELRQAPEVGVQELSGAPHSFRKDCHVFKASVQRALPSEVDVLWRQLSPKVRNQVRKARKSGCRSRVGGRELLTDFYAVFAENMRDLGSPVHSRDLFAEVVETLDDRVCLAVIYREGAPAAAAMVLSCNAILHNPWASSLRRMRPHCPNMLLYWTMLELAINHGCRRFDFGRSSPGAPTCRFKLQWGADMSPLPWHVISLTSSEWDPKQESLELDWWKALSVHQSIEQGPSIRKWISL